MEKIYQDLAVDVKADFEQVKLLYLFGSRASGDIKQTSDYDFAVYLDNCERANFGNLKLDLINYLSDFLQTEELDLVVLNTAESYELKFNIIKDGLLLIDDPLRLIFEPRVRIEFFDFQMHLRQFNLTKT
jgi:predicted nucleotidyltransferase